MSPKKMNTYLPEWIYFKKGIVNPKCDDKESFKWATIMSLFPEKHTDRISKNQRRKAKEFDFLPNTQSIEEIDLFEKNNDVSVSVLTDGPGKSFIPWRVTKIRENHVTLFLYYSRFFTLRNLSRLLGSGGGKRRKEFCEGCFREKKKNKIHCCKIPPPPPPPDFDFLPPPSEFADSFSPEMKEEEEEEEMKEEKVEEEMKEEKVEEEMKEEEEEEEEEEEDEEKKKRMKEKRAEKAKQRQEKYWNSLNEKFRIVRKKQEEEELFRREFSPKEREDEEKLIEKFAKLSDEEKKPLIQKYITGLKELYNDNAYIFMVEELFSTHLDNLKEMGFKFDLDNESFL